MAATGDSCFLLADFSSKDSSLKNRLLRPNEPKLSRMNRNLVGSNYGRSSVNLRSIANFVLKIFSSDQNEPIDKHDC